MPLHANTPEPDAGSARKSRIGLFYLIALAAMAFPMAGAVGCFSAGLIGEAAEARAEDMLRGAGAGWARVEADGLRLTLAGEAPDQAAREDALALLADMRMGGALARVVAIDGATTAPAPEIAAPPPAPAAPDRPQPVDLVVSHDRGRLTISGIAPDPLIGESLAAYARAVMPGATVETSLRHDGEFSPEWRAAALTMIAVLAKLEVGTARLAPDLVEIEGGVADPLTIGPLQRELTEGLGEGMRATTRLTVSPRRLAEAEPLPPSRCAAELTGTAGRDPIRFAPGSAEIDAASAPVIAALARIVRRCVGGRIEIAGHTDSQGSEATNQRLSRARAEAVLNALLDAGARLTLLSAAGYGEAEPVADNKTEAGRARNRRIEFRALNEGENP
ncbi:MAG: OmpA family protein [Pikeienuella sp.]